MPLKAIPAEALLDLRRRLNTLAPQTAERRRLMQETAALYGVSESTLYRKLRAGGQLRPAQRQDRDVPKVLPEAQLIRYCELVAALKIHIANKKGRHLSTAEAIRLLEKYGLDTPDGFVKAPQGVLTKPTVNRYLKHWGLDQQRLTREPPAVRFQARFKNTAAPMAKRPKRRSSFCSTPWRRSPMNSWRCAVGRWPCIGIRGQSPAARSFGASSGCWISRSLLMCHAGMTAGVRPPGRKARSSSPCGR